MIPYIPLFLLALLGVPVPLDRIYPRHKVALQGALLHGDGKQPHTFIAGRGTVYNLLRNLLLAKFRWNIYSVMKVTTPPLFGGVRVAFQSEDDGKWSVLPQLLSGGYIAGLHGYEHCRFALVDQLGSEVPYTVVVRSEKNDAVVRLARQLSLYPFQTKDLITFV